MKLATSIGINIIDFWEMTPHELSLTVQGYTDRKKEEYKEKVSIAYLNSMWTIQWLGEKSKHPESLEKILEKIYKEESEMTNEDMLNQVKALNSMFGGEVIVNGKE